MRNQLQSKLSMITKACLSFYIPTPPCATSTSGSYHVICLNVIGCLKGNCT